MRIESEPEQDYFRDHLSNLNDDGKRKWLYPRVEKGPLLRWRTAVAVVLLAALFAGPWLSIDGHPLFLFNVPERRFILFGVPFWPQDFHLIAIGLLGLVVFIALFTVVYGRVWCGWACPQTIFMEMVFRKIEIWIEGDQNARRRLDNTPWTAGKILKKGAKHGLFLLVAFLISNTFLLYVMGRDAWLKLVTDNPFDHLGGLTAILIFTLVFYLVFARLREIVCITICPYGRLQGVLLDKHSIVVAYDYVRGEPRGPLRREGLRRRDGGDSSEGRGGFALPYGTIPATRAIPAIPAPKATPKGDCIDCKLCVQVCPTGIDIRNGTQLECVNCTACIDACDHVMTKIDRPLGLIRFDSLEGIENRPANDRTHAAKISLTGRMKAYTAVLLAIIGLWGYLLLSRSEVETTVLRAPGQLFQREANGMISNLYNIEFVNKTYETLPLEFRVMHPDARIRMVLPIRKVPPAEMVKGSFFILLPERSIRQSSTRLEIEIRSNGQVVDHVTTTFLGPI